MSEAFYWLAILVVILGAFVFAGWVEWILSRPSRRWLKHLRDVERARVAWAARVIETQVFWKQEK